VGCGLENNLGMIEDIAKAFAAVGTVRAAEGNTPFLLADTERVYLVEAGSVDVFLVQVENGAPVGPRHFLCRVAAGEAALGIPETTDGFGLLAVGGVGTQLRVLDRGLVQAAHIDICTHLVDGFLRALGSAAQHLDNPQLHVLLPFAGAVTVKTDHFCGVREGVVWLRAEGATARLAGEERVSLTEAFPLPGGMWVAADDEHQWHCATSREVLAEQSAWAGLQTFLRAAVVYVGHQIVARAQMEQTRLSEKARADDDERAKTLMDLASIMDADADAPSRDVTADATLAVFQAVGRAGGIQFAPLPGWQKTTKASEMVHAICKASAVGYRQVVLRDAWWSADIGPLICLKITDAGNPSLVAVLPVKPGACELFDPATDTRCAIDETVAAQLEPLAYSFYRPLPPQKLSLLDLWRFMRFDLIGDLHTVLMVGIAGLLLGLVVPVMTGYLFNTVIPNTSHAQLWEMFAGLLVATLAGALFEVTRSFAILRIETKANASLQMAVFDRVLRLPLAFFRNYSAGDLAERANGINALRQALGGATLGVLLSGIVSLGNFVLLFYYSSYLALIATGILILNVAVTGYCSYRSMRYIRKLQDVAGKLSGLVLQLLTGIAKLRVSGAESRVFSLWAARYREQKRLAFGAGRLENFQQVFNSFIPITSSLAIFLTAMQMMRDDPTEALTTGDFIAFNAAFGTFLAAAVSLTATLINLLNVVPQLERAKPILETLPEIDPSRPDPGILEGHLEINHVTFRYREDGPLILNDLSFRADPGEFIAFVGPSGAGKSTLLRMLLGFDTPESGAVYYDGQDIAQVDVSAVRQQVGIVLQSSKLTLGSVHSNIAGTGSPLTMDDAWEALRMAGLEDDVKAMPMGIHTLVSEGGSTLSGGQRQRLLIARAIASKPRLIFFDEATSALDNRTQQIVSESLERMNATRVVIAHRLSTIKNADRIYVLERGQVVQSGRFEELLSQPGLFAELAARQMA
jgi:NHLM bacteriocin system ABC transporter ATP-binding protein